MAWVRSSEDTPSRGVLKGTGGSLLAQGVAAFFVGDCEPLPDGICLRGFGGYVARMIVDVMTRPEIHDPQG